VLQAEAATTAVGVEGGWRRRRLRGWAAGLTGEDLVRLIAAEYVVVDGGKEGKDQSDSGTTVWI